MKETKKIPKMLKLTLPLFLTLLLTIALTNAFIKPVLASDTGILQSGDFKYKTYDKNVDICEYTGTDVNVVIPEEIDGLPVTGLNEYVFDKYTIDIEKYEGKKYIKSISLPANLDGISDLEEGYFSRHTKLESITVHPNNKRFSSQDGVLYDKKKKHLYAYPRSKEGQEYKIPASVKYIGAHAFKRTQLKKVDIPKSVRLIRGFAFCGSDIESITLRNVKRIGSRAFSDCKNLKNVTLSKNLVAINRDVFSDSTKLTNIRLPESIVSIGEYAFTNCKSLKAITIPENVKKIERWAFMGCKDLKSVKFSEGLRKIEEGAFTKCKKLKKAVLPKTVNTLEKKAFPKTCKVIRK